MKRMSNTDDKVEVTVKNRKGITYFSEKFPLHATVMDIKRAIWANSL